MLGTLRACVSPPLEVLFCLEGEQVAQHKEPGYNGESSKATRQQGAAPFKAGGEQGHRVPGQS